MPEHSHCKYCGEPIRFGTEYCNDECRSAEMERDRKERLKDNLFFAICAVTIVVIFVVKMIL